MSYSHTPAKPLFVTPDQAATRECGELLSNYHDFLVKELQEINTLLGDNSGSHGQENKRPTSSTMTAKK